MKLGIENIDLYLDIFKVKRVGLVTNPTGTDQNLKTTIEILNEKTNLTLLFSPEHGVRGDIQAGKHVGDYIDQETNIKVYSLYGENRAPNEEMLDQIDILCFDIQDVGARFYTYLYTLAYAMIACQKAGKKVVVFDRPNPLGDKVEGTILNPKYKSFVGYYPITQRYGLTIGELANYFNNEFQINCDLEVIKMTDYKNGMTFDSLNMPFVMPSPNIPSIDTMYHYLATCIFEGTNLSEGRGTTRPFSIIGAPWLKSREVLSKLNELSIEGVLFKETHFTPTFSKHSGTLCKGIELYTKDKDLFKPVELSFILYKIIEELHDEFDIIPPFKEGREPFINLLTGDNFLEKQVPLKDILEKMKKDTETFTLQKERYHLYE